jgi:hypothetical protein
VSSHALRVPCIASVSRAGQTIVSGGLVTGTDLTDGAGLKVQVTLSSGYVGVLCFISADFLSVPSDGSESVLAILQATWWSCSHPCPSQARTTSWL